MKKSNDDKAIEHLSADNRTWKWIMKEKRFDEILAQYRKIHPKAPLAYLSWEVMEYCNDKDDAVNHFRRVRNCEICTNGLAIFKLALEISQQCGLAISPFDFATPTGKNEEASGIAMEYLWSHDGLEDKLKSAHAEVMEVYKKYGIELPLSDSELVFVTGPLNIVHQRFKKIFGVIFPPIFELPNKFQKLTTKTQVFAFLVGMILLIGAAGLMMSQSCGSSLESSNQTLEKSNQKALFHHPREDTATTYSKGKTFKLQIRRKNQQKPKESANNPKQQTNQSKARANTSLGEKQQIESSRMLEFNSNTDNTKTIYKNQNVVVFQKADASIEKAETDNKIIHESSHYIQIGMDTKNGRFTLDGIDNSYHWSLSGDKCEKQFFDERYYICSIAGLNPGKYRVSFGDVEGYRTPPARDISFHSGIAMVTGDYLREKSPQSADLQILIKKNVTSVEITSKAIRSSGQPAVQIKANRNLCEIPKDSFWATCNFNALPFGYYFVKY